MSKIRVEPSGISHRPSCQLGLAGLKVRLHACGNRGGDGRHGKRFALQANIRSGFPVGGVPCVGRILVLQTTMMVFYV